MKKIKRKIIAGASLAAVAAVTLTGCGNKKPEAKVDESKRSAVHTEDRLFVNEYTMDVTLSPDENKVEIISTANVENNTEQTIDEIIFLNPSAKVYGKEGNSGKGWEIKNIYAGSDESSKFEFTQEGNNSEIIKVKLGDKKLAPKDKLDITISVNEDIPFGDSRFGFFNMGKYQEYVLTSCFPQMAEYRSGEWIINDTVWSEERIKDNGLYQFTDYHVTVHAPEGYLAAASGVEQKEEDGTIKIEAVDTDDFAMVLCNGFRSAYYANDDMIANYYFIEDSKSYKEAKEVVEIVLPVTFDWMVDKIEKYAWNQYDIVPIYNDSGCNTYTGLMTFGAKDIYDGLDGAVIDDYRIKSVNVFEEGILDQWFSKMTGSNRATDGWLSRGMLLWFNDYISISATNDKPVRKIKDILNEAKEKYPEEMNMKLNDKFKDAETAYIVDTYKGAEFLEALHGELGDEDFTIVMNEFMNEFMFKDAKSQDFINTLMKHDNGKIQAIVDDYFNK